MYVYIYIYVIGINRVHTLTTIGMRLLRTVAASGTEVVFPLRFLHDCSHKHECHQSSLNSRSAVHPVPSISWYSMFIIVYPSISKCLSMFKSFISHITLLSPWVFFQNRCDTTQSRHIPPGLRCASTGQNSKTATSCDEWQSLFNQCDLYVSVHKKITKVMNVVTDFVRNSGMKWVTVISLNYFQWLSSFFCRFGSFWEVWGLEEWSRRHEQLRKEANLCLPCFTVSDSACIAYYIIIYIYCDCLSCWFLVFESILRL